MDLALEIERLEEENTILAENKIISDEEKLIAQQEIDFEIEEAKRTHATNILDIAADQAKKEISIEKTKGSGLKKSQAAGLKALSGGFDIAQQGIENRFSERFANLKKQHESLQ